MHHALSIENDVIIGGDDQLFLAQGAHRSLDRITGKLKTPPEAIANLRRNLDGRRKFCAKMRAPYCHLVAPDKHSVLREQFPLKAFIPLGETVRAQGVTDFLYPVAELTALSTGAYLPTDTHWSPYAAIVACELIAAALGLPKEDVSRCADAVRGCLKAVDEPVTGDLGSKLTPPRQHQALAFQPSWRMAAYANGVRANNGKLAAIRNEADFASGKAIIFGDSFVFHYLKIFASFFRETIVCRTPYLHREIVFGARPDFVVTQSVERYLASTPSDDEAPPFLMMGDMSGAPANYRKGAAENIARMLTGRSDVRPRAPDRAP